jgi:SAM-dependent methyltransferase
LSPRQPDFGPRAEEYDHLRPVDERWWTLFERLVDEADLRGRRVLDVGCGTGRLCAALAERGLARAWGVDAEPRMLEVAHRNVPRTVGLKQGRAEKLPFKDAWFDRIVFWLAAHLVDRSRAFAEAARVLEPGGRLALVTFEPAHFSQHWLTPFFPSLERIDRARFPTPTQLRAELEAAGFATPRFVPAPDEETLTREQALERIHRGHISTFDLLDPTEVEAGTARAERKLPERVPTRRLWLLVVADRLMQ